MRLMAENSNGDVKQATDVGAKDGIINLLELSLESQERLES